MVRPVSFKGFQGVSLRGFRGFQIFLWELCVCIKYLGLGENTVIGHKRIVRLNGIYTDCLRLVIDDARVRPALSFLAVYREEAPETPLWG